MNDWQLRFFYSIAEIRFVFNNVISWINHNNILYYTFNIQYQLWLLTNWFYQKNIVRASTKHHSKLNNLNSTLNLTKLSILYIIYKISEKKSLTFIFHKHKHKETITNGFPVQLSNMPWGHTTTKRPLGTQGIS